MGGVPSSQILDALGRDAGYAGAWSRFKDRRLGYRWQTTELPNREAVAVAHTLNAAVVDNCCVCCSNVLIFEKCNEPPSFFRLFEHLLGRNLARYRVYIPEDELQLLIQMYQQCPHGKEVVAMVRQLLTQPTFSVRTVQERLSSAPALTEAEKHLLQAAIHARAERVR